MTISRTDRRGMRTNRFSFINSRLNFIPVHLFFAKNIPWFAIALFLAMNCAAGAASQTKNKSDTAKTHTFGIYLGNSNAAGQSAGQIKMIAEKFCKVLAERHGQIIEVAYYLSPKEVEAAAGKHKIDIFMTVDANVIQSAVQKSGYIPLAGYSMFEKNDQICIYAQSQNARNGIAGLRNKKILLRKNSYDFFALRDMVKDNPNAYFSTANGSGKFGSLFYLLSLGEADAVLSTTWTMDFFKISNPGPVKDVKPVACERNLNNIILLKRKGLDPEFVKKAMELLLTFHKDTAFKEFRSIGSMTKFRYIPIDEADSKAFFDFLEMARKKGWHEEYESWLAYQD